MPEAAGAEEHDRKQQEVIARVNQCACSHGAGDEARAAKDQADTYQQHKRPQRIASLFRVHVCERSTCENRSRDHCGDRPLRMAICAEWRRRDVANSFHGPVECRAKCREEKSAKESLLKEGCEGDAEAK